MKTLYESVFGKDIHNFQIEEEISGKIYSLKAIRDDEYREVAGYLKIAGNTIVKLAITEKHDPSYELLKFACAKFDEMNQPLVVDENAISINFKRLLEEFGFKTGNDSLMMRTPYAVIALDYIL